MNYFLLFLGCVLVLCLAIAVGVGLRPPGAHRDPAAH